MITPSTNVARGGLSNPEVRNSSRPESSADFREEVSRERVRERSTERARGADAVRAERADPEARATDESDSDSVQDETSTDASSDTRENGAPREHEAVTRETPVERDAARPTATGASEVDEGAKPGTTPRAATAESPAAPGVPPALVAPLVSLPQVAENSNPSARTSSDASATLQPENEAVAAVGSPTPKPLAAASDAAADAPSLPPDAMEHDAATLEALELPRDVRPGSAPDGGSNALAIAARGPMSIADVAPTAPAAPIATPRLTPAEIPQFLKELQVHVNGAARSAFVELEPLALGRLTVELSLQPEGGVRADVRAERPDGYAAIEARLPELRASLIERGFASADVQISLGLAQRDSRREGDDMQPRRARRDASRTLDTERVLALAPNRTGSIDLWA